MRRENKDIIITCKSIDEASLLFEQLRNIFAQIQLQQMLRSGKLVKRRIYPRNVKSLNF